MTKNVSAIDRVLPLIIGLGMLSLQFVLDGSQRWLRLIGFPMAFARGFLMLLGARIVDGCIGGHGISGIAQLSIGSFVAVAAMFEGRML